MSTLTRGRLLILLPTKLAFIPIAWFAGHSIAHVVLVEVCLTATWLIIAELPAWGNE